MDQGKSYNKSFKFVPALRASTGRGSAAPLNSDVISTRVYEKFPNYHSGLNTR